MRLLLLLIFFQPVFLINAQNSIEDSALYVKTKASFLKFEQEHGHFIETKNIRMHYLTWGNPKGKAFIWVHGSYSNAYEFYGFADSLVKEGYFVIAIDYYGHGFTPMPAKEVSLYHVADDIKFLLDYLQIKKTVIGGWSRGGSIATAFYDAYPEYVAGIILEDGGSVAWATVDHIQPIDSMTIKIKNDFENYSNYANQEFSSEFEAVKQRANLKNEGFVYRTLATLKQIRPGKWSANAGLADMLGEGSAEQFLKIFYQPFASSDLFGASTMLLYPKIIYRNLDIPLMILDPVSKNDQFYFEEENSKLRKAHPVFITHKIYPNTSHGLKFQKPDDFLSDVKSFLKSVINLNLKNQPGTRKKDLL